MTGPEELFDSAKIKPDEAPRVFHQDLIDALRLGVISIVVMLIAAFFFSRIVHPLFALGSVEETAMDVLRRLILLALPFVAYIAASSVARRYTGADTVRALALALTCTVILFALISTGHYALNYGVFAPQPSLQMTLSQTDAGIRVDAIECRAAQPIPPRCKLATSLRPYGATGWICSRSTGAWGKRQKAIRCACDLSAAMKKCRRPSALFSFPTNS